MRFADAKKSIVEINDPNGRFETPGILMPVISRIVHVPVDTARAIVRGLAPSLRRHRAMFGRQIGASANVPSSSPVLKIDS